MTYRPRYEHDCQTCVYLGQDEDYDLYFCPQGGRLPTVIARYSSRPADYTSGMVFVGIDPYLTRAHQLATERGLM